MADTPISELEARLAAASAPPVDPVDPVDPVARIDALNELAWALRGTDAPRANGLATEARQLSLEHAYKLGQARAVRTLAMTVHDPEDLQKVFLRGEEAKRLFDEAGDDVGRAASRDFLATIHEHIGDIDGALALALDALSIARRLGDPIRQGYALANVGGCLAASGELDLAVERLSEALGLFEGEQELAGVGAICSRLSKVLADGGRRDEALAYAERCRELAAETDDDFLGASALTVMARLEEQRGDLVEAERLHRLALDGLEGEIAQRIIGAESRVAIGRLLINRGELDAAERELRDALDRVEGQAVSIVTETAVHETLATLYEQQGDLGATVEHLRRAQALRERIGQRDARNKLAQVEARAAMEAAKKDAEIHKLRFVELQRMQSKLVEAERMAVLGKLAAGTAHELNTPLGVLRSNAELSATAAERFASRVGAEQQGRGGEVGAQARKLAAVLASCRDNSDDAIARIGAIAESFERFAQLDQTERRAFDVREGLESALALLGPTIREGIALERRLAEVPRIEAWPRELNHAFMTVLQNAVQSIDGAGTVTVETGVTEAHVLVRVRDTGRGMSEAQTARLFDVDWSEHGDRMRMRLGLSAAYTTMQKHRGAIEVESAVGEGTTVAFRFPRINPGS